MSTSEPFNRSVKDEPITKSDLVVEDAKETDASSSTRSTENKQEISPEERRLIAKLDKRILPIVCLMYLFSCARSTIIFQVLRC